MNSNTTIEQATEAQSPRTPLEHDESGRPLFPSNESEGLRSRWQTIQGDFVDEPRNAVENADKLVADAAARLTEICSGERERIERECPKGADISTEDCRQALRRYRSLFDRLLSV